MKSSAHLLAEVCTPLRELAIGHNCNYTVLCKSKLVILTTEWLPWLHICWRDSPYKRFTVVWRLIAQGNPRGSCRVHLTSTIRWQPSGHLWRSHYSKLQRGTAMLLCPSQMFWGTVSVLWLKENWTAASQVAFSVSQWTSHNHHLTS